jgi:hypothetical protein
MQTITTFHVSLHLNTVNKPSSISEDVMETRINSQPCKGNNMTAWQTRATKANEWPPFAMTIKESVRVLPRTSAIFHMKAPCAAHGWPNTIPSEQPYNEVSYRLAQRPLSHLASGGISVYMLQYATQMLVPRGLTDAARLVGATTLTILNLWTITLSPFPSGILHFPLIVPPGLE